MTNSYTLGKNGKFGEIDFSKLRSGITKAELGIQEGSVLDSIWKSIDTNQEGDSKDRLDRQELNQLIKIVRELCGKDNNLSANETKNFKNNSDSTLSKKHKEELLTFLSKLSELTKDVAKVEAESNMETITYEDGHKEQVKPDGSKIIISKDGKTITEKDSDNNTTKETAKTDDGEIVTEYEQNSRNPKKQTITNKNSQSVILYANGKKIKQTTTLKENGEIQEYDYAEGQPILKRITNQKTGEALIYNKGKLASKTITTKTNQGTQVSNTVYDGDNLTESISLNGKERYQKKVIDGREYEVRYDENGNTTGVIVQNGESIKAIADKFGVDSKQLVKANAHLLKGGKHSFSAGDEIVIPRKMEADEYVSAQKGRKDAEGAKADYRVAAEQRAAAKRAQYSHSEKENTDSAKLYDWKGKKDQDWVYIQIKYAKGSTAEGIAKDLYKREGVANPSKEAVKARAKAILQAYSKYFDSKGVLRGTQRLSYRISKRTAPVVNNNKKSFDTAAIKQEADELAKAIHKQITGASLNQKTIGYLRAITPENAAFVIESYQKNFGISLAKDIDDEWGLDINTIKEHVCKKLVQQAQQLHLTGIYYKDFQKINDINSLQNWINHASAKIRQAMGANSSSSSAANKSSQTTNSQQVQKQSAKQIIADLKKAINWWNDVDKVKQIINRIDNPEELKEVNRLLVIEGYTQDDKYSPIEKFIYEEANNSAVHIYNSSDYLEQTVQKWIDNGTLKGQEANQAQARMAARVLYDGGDGFGTDCDKIKKAVRMIKCPKPTGNRAADNKQAREVYRLVNAMIKKHNTFYGLGSPCTDLLDYCKGEMWEGEVKYLKGILAETNAIQGKEKAQAIKDLTQEAVEGAGTDIEYLEQAIKGIDSPEDRKAVEAKLKEYCSKKGIKPQIKGQSYLQAILYDECDKFMGIGRDHKEIRKFNEMLIEQGAYSEAEVVNLRAEQAALQILEGDFSNIKDAVEQLKEPKVLAKLNQLLTTKGYKSLDELLNKNLNQTKSDLVNAELASNSLLPNEKAADVAYRLIKNSDFNNRAQGMRAIRNEAIAKLVDAKLKKEGSSLAKVVEQFNKEKADYKAKADFWDGLGKFIPVVGGYAEDISDAYRTNTDSSDNMFVEMERSQNLSPGQKAAYSRTVKLMEQKLAQMEKDYKAALDSQGAVSWAVNHFCEKYGIGTTREEIEARIEHDKETIRLLKLAAEGKLGKMVNGKTVSVTFEEVFKERNINTNFDRAKVEKVDKQAQRLVAMNYAKTNIAICWEELGNGLSSSDSKRLSVAIIDTLEKLSNMTGKKLSLASYGYSIQNGIIVDSKGKPVAVNKLKELAMQLKQGLSDIAKGIFGNGIPLNTSSSKINDLLENLYDTKKESFKEEFKAAFGQDCPDEMVENYISTIETGKMVVNMGALIGAVVAAPFTGGGSLAVFAAGAGVSLGLNALEHSTDANGWTNAEWTSDAEQAMWDGILSSLGMKVGMVADAKAVGVYKTAAQSMLKKLVPNITEKTLDRASVCIARVRAMGYEVSSDTIQSLAQTYCQHGEFDEESFVRDLLMSAAGNAAGHITNAIGDVKAGKVNADVDIPKESSSAEAPRSVKEDEIANGETVKNSEQSHSNTQERANIDDGVEGTPTRENVDEYQRENAHLESIPEERIDIDENNANAAEVKPNEETPEVETPHADAAEELIDSTFGSYSEMNENELFVEYQRLNNEFKYGGLSQTEKAARVKELQKIQKELETKGFRVENNGLVSRGNNSSQNVNQTAEPEVNSTQLKAKLGEKLFAIYQGVERSIDSLKDISGYNKLKTLIANKFNNSPTEFSNLITRLNKKAKEIGLNIVETSVDRTARMGKSLSKFYDKIENAIDKMKDLERFNKLLDKITTRFANFKDDMKALLDKLYDKAQALGLSIKESIHDVYSRVGIKAEGVNPLDKYTRSKTGADMSKTHTEWFISRKNLFKDNHDYPGMVWSGYTPKDRHHGAWKMHLYSVSEADWREMCDVIIPYLKDHDIDWKTYNSAHGADCLNGSKQQGKAFTIYPKNNEDMAQIAKDLDYIIRRNKLETSGSHIIGDNQMGSTGRLFYRYEFNSKEHMDEILDLSPNSPDWNKYIQTDKYGRQIGGYYDANRGEGKYLASDMTDADDIWRNFDPSDPNALPIKIEKLRKGEPFEIYGSAKLNLANIVELDLNEPRIKALIDNLPEGGRLTIGREGDIRINDVSNKISRIHAIIEKHNGKIYVIDNSANGTRVRMEISSPQKQSQSSTNNSSKSEHAKVELDPIREQACNKFDKNIQPVEMPENGVLDRNNQYLLNLNEPPALRLVDGTIVDLGRSDILDKIKNLQEGEFITLGRTGDITVSNSSNVSRHHILITKQNGQIQIKDVSSFANTRALSQAEREVRANAIRKFNKNQPLFEMPDNGMLNPDKNYFLDFADLPKLRLTDGTIIDLSSPKYYSAIRHLQEGRFITLGRTGFADIGISNSNTISRHHILITIQNGELILKDISSNGGTYRVKNSSQYENYSRDNNSRRSEGSGNAHNSNSASNNANKINDYKKLLDISEDTPLTKDVIKKAYRKKCLEWHPDRHPENEAECKVMMQKLNEAKEILDKLIPENS